MIFSYVMYKTFPNKVLCIIVSKKRFLCIKNEETILMRETIIHRNDFHVFGVTLFYFFFFFLELRYCGCHVYQYLIISGKILFKTVSLLIKVL